MNVDTAQTFETLKSVLKSQYHAALATLKQAIDSCPDDLWTSEQFSKPYWRVVYHTLYFTHFYLQPNVAAFIPWEHDQQDVHSLDDRPLPNGFEGFEDLRNLPISPPQTGVPYTKDQLLLYWNICDGMIDAGVDRLELLSNDCGFSWYRVPKLEHQIINIRHIQHHAVQLAERLRCVTDIRLEWVGSKRAGSRTGSS